MPIKHLLDQNWSMPRLIWDPHTRTQINQIEKVQRRAARYVTNRYHNTSSVTDMLQNLNWPSLEITRTRVRALTDRKGSRSTRIPESPRVPSERYDRQPCLCVFVARFDRRIFYYSSKTDSSWGCVAKVTASHLLIARPRHCLIDTPG